MHSEIMSNKYLILIITSMIFGTLARIFTLIVDYRQYPTYPNGYLIHLVTGFVASAIGAIAVPAMIARDFEAVTFLALAIEQFREVRRIENESLSALDDVENVSRGEAYIDGIAKTFEARNYFSLLVAFSSCLTMELVPRKILWLNLLCGAAAAIIIFFILKNFSKGKTIGDIAYVKPGTISVRGSELYVDDIFVTNHIGLDDARELVKNEGICAVIHPKKEHYRITLDSPGQTQAVLFEACRVLGVKRYHFTRREYKSGRVAVFLVPIIKNEDALLETIRRTPLLESAKKSYEIMKTDFFKNIR